MGEVDEPIGSPSSGSREPDLIRHHVLCGYRFSRTGENRQRYLAGEWEAVNAR